MRLIVRPKKFTAAFLSFLVVMAISSASACASGGEGGHDKKQWIDFAWKTFDFIVLVGFLFWLLKDKIKKFFVDRRVEIKEKMEITVLQKEEAQKKFREYSEKIDKASGEIDGIFEMIKAQGVAEKQKIIADAEKAALKIKDDTRARLAQEMKKASDQLREEAVELSVQMAEEILKRNITAQDNESMVRQYMDKVVSKH